MVNLQECYEKFGGDYDGVMGRLRREQLVRKLLYKFLDDKNFELFEASMQRQEYDEALRAVHTLKGICQNLSITRLGSSAARLTDALRGGWTPPADALLEEVKRDYREAVDAITAFEAGLG